MFKKNNLFLWYYKFIKIKTKKKFKKRRFKKKRFLKRYRIFKKLKRILSRKKKKFKLTYNRVGFLSPVYRLKSPEKNFLNQRMTLTKKLIEDANVLFFFKVNKYPRDEYDNYLLNLTNNLGLKSIPLNTELTIF